MFNSIFKVIISSAIVVTPFLATSQVQAADENVYDSSACRVLFGSEAVQTEFALVNLSTTEIMIVRCPITRDRNHRVVDTDHSYVTVRDHHNRQTVGCELASLHTDSAGNIGLIDTNVSTTAARSANTFDRLYFPSANLSTQADASFYIDCHIPPMQASNFASGILNYYIDED